MKKIILLVSFLLLIPFGARALEADYNIDGLYINADVQTNGDMLVKEQIVMDGSFNGYIRDLYYKGEQTLYDASDLSIQRVCELSYDKKGSFDFSNRDLTCFTLNDYAVQGDSYVYARTNYIDSVSLKMFDYTENGTKIFYIEYLLKDVVVAHNDVAELYWTFIGENFDDDIADVKITINLPDKANELRAWAHGPLDGNVEPVNGKQIIATIPNLYANNLVDIRATFDKSVVPLCAKTSDDSALPSILKQEQQRADEANRQRAIARALVYIFDGISGLWIVCAIALGIFTYRKYDKERKSTFNLEYCRELPGEYGPEVVEYLMKRHITSVSLSAMILNIICKKGLIIREDLNKHGKKEYVLVRTALDKTKLTAEEVYVLEWIIDDLGNGTEVSLKDIKNASNSMSSAEDFIKKYDKWANICKLNGEREEFYEDFIGYKIKGCLFAALGIVIFVISMALTITEPLTILTLPISIILIIYIASFTRRTVKGNDHFVKWKAFKKFLMDFGRFNEKELPEIALWEKYLVYATVFGIAEKVSKEMQMKVANMGYDTTNMPMYTNFYINHYFATNLVSTVNEARSLSISRMASTSSSSGSGFGGGFSGGGGFGGGGVGGGGRGF